MTDLTVRGIRLTLYPGSLTDPSSPMYEAIQRAGRIVVDRAKENLSAAGNVDTGRLRNSLEYEVKVEGDLIKATVGTRVKYGWWVDQGNDPGGGWIYPRRAQVLRFKPKGGGAWVFAERVRAYSGSRFLTNAKDSLTAADFEP